MWPGMPFSAFRSSATNCVTYFRMQCSSERTGKWRISNGYQPRSGVSPVPKASWFPRPTRTSATPRWADFECVLSGWAWNVGVARRTVIRSAKRRSSSGRGTKLRHAPLTTPNRDGTASRTSFRLESWGHQNSSASVFSTQSAPKRVAASRAMRVTHSLWRRSSPGSRIRCRRPSRSYRSRISVVPSRERLSVAITKSTPAARWNAICASTTSASSRTSSVMTSFIGVSLEA